jgi:sister-chromatid-cohesion protein PDS5
MSRSFADPSEAEESFQILDQLNDTNIWKILTHLVDPNTSFHQTCAYRVMYLKLMYMFFEILLLNILLQIA